MQLSITVNLPTVIIAAVLAALLLAVAVRGVRRRRRGGSGCGRGCSGCPYAARCGGEKKK